MLRASSQVVYLSYLRIKQAVMSEFFLQNISWPIFCPGDFGPMESVFDGGQSTIFLAEFQKNKEFQRVIIKWFDDRPEAQAAFMTEVQVLMHVRHPAIVPLIGILEHPKGYALVLKRGEISATRLISCIQEKLFLPPLVIRYIFFRLLEGLVHLHGFRHGLSCEIVHGDISAQNILFFQGRAVFIDFGAALIGVDGQAKAFGLRRNMSPEHLLGYPGPWSDLYSLASVIFELTLLRSFDSDQYGREFKELAQILGPGNHDLFVMIRSCLAPCPTLRPKSALVVAKNLKPLNKDEKISARQFLYGLTKDLF